MEEKQRGCEWIKMQNILLNLQSQEEIIWTIYMKKHLLTNRKSLQWHLKWTLLGVTIVKVIFLALEIRIIE